MSAPPPPPSVNARTVALALVANGLLFALASAMTRTFEMLVDTLPFEQKMHSWLVYSAILFAVAFGVLFAALRAGDPLIP